MPKLNNSIDNFLNVSYQSEALSHINPQNYNKENISIHKEKNIKNFKCINLEVVNENKNLIDLDNKNINNNNLLFDNENNNNFTKSKNISMNNNLQNFEVNDFNFDPGFINKGSKKYAKNVDSIEAKEKFHAPKSLENLKNKINLKVKIPNNNKEGLEEKIEKKQNEVQSLSKQNYKADSQGKQFIKIY
jgi:hypothetical protein